MAMQTWVSNVASCIQREDGESLKDIFGILNSHERTWRQLPSFLSTTGEKLITNQINQSLFHLNIDEKWIEYIIELIGSMEATSRKEYVGAYKGLSAAYVKLLNVVGNETAWILPVLFQTTYDMRVLSGILTRSTTFKLFFCFFFYLKNTFYFLFVSFFLQKVY